MGFLDNLKDKAEEFGEKAKEGFEAAKDRASGLVDDVKERFDDDEGSAGSADATADPSPEAVGNESYGLDDAVAESTFVEDTLPDGTVAPAADSDEDPVVEADDPMVEPVDVTEDPPAVRPVEPGPDSNDSLDPRPDGAV